MLTILTPPRSTALTTLAVVKSELNISGSAEDVRLARLIAEATAAVETHLNRRLCRMIVRQRTWSNGGNTLKLKHQPVVQILAVKHTCDGVTTVLDEVEIIDPEAGVIYRAEGFPHSYRMGRPAGGLEDGVLSEPAIDYEIDYVGGYLLPGDDYAAATLSFSASDDSINDAAALLPLVAPVAIDVGAPLIISQADTVTVSGSGAGNNGAFVVKSRTGAKLIGDIEMFDEAAGPTIALAVRNLDPLLERAAINTLSALRSTPIDRDPTIKSVSLPGVSVSYGAAGDVVGGDASLVPALVQPSIKKWRRRFA